MGFMDNLMTMLIRERELEAERKRQEEERKQAVFMQNAQFMQNLLLRMKERREDIERQERWQQQQLEFEGRRLGLEEERLRMAKASEELSQKTEGLRQELMEAELTERRMEQEQKPTLLKAQMLGQALNVASALLDANVPIEKVQEIVNKFSPDFNVADNLRLVTLRKRMSEFVEKNITPYAGIKMPDDAVIKNLANVAVQQGVVGKGEVDDAVRLIRSAFAYKVVLNEQAEKAEQRTLQRQTSEFLKRSFAVRSSMGGVTTGGKVQTVALQPEGLSYFFSSDTVEGKAWSSWFSKAKVNPALPMSSGTMVISETKKSIQKTLKDNKLIADPVWVDVAAAFSTAQRVSEVLMTGDTTDKTTISKFVPEFNHQLAVAMDKLGMHLAKQKDLEIDGVNVFQLGQENWTKRRELLAKYLSKLHPALPMFLVDSDFNKPISQRMKAIDRVIIAYDTHAYGGHLPIIRQQQRRGQGSPQPQSNRSSGMPVSRDLVR